MLVMLSTSLLLGAQVSKADIELAKTIKVGKRSSKLLLTTLGSKMKAKMAQGGVMKTLDFCSDEAYTLTQKVNKMIPKGVKVKRISRKYRSPANAPKSDEVVILESFDTLLKANAVLPEYIIQRVDAKTDKYYKPLVIKEKTCLLCHGEVSKDIDFRRKLEGRYPLDKAIGYKMGDLRGAIVVTVKRK